MTETYPCDQCEQEFESLDEFVDHLHEVHDVPEGNIRLSYTPPDNQELPQQTAQNPVPSHAAPHQSQPVENPVRAMVENPNETEELIDTLFNRWQESKEQSLKHRFRLVLIVAVLFLSVLIASSYLTQQQILPGSAYTLLLGTIIGYLLTFLEDYL